MSRANILTLEEAAHYLGAIKSTANGWIKRMRIKDVGRDYNNRLLYKRSDIKQIEKALVVTNSGRNALRVPKSVLSKPIPTITPVEIKERYCSSCGKKLEGRTTLKTCGSKECLIIAKRVNSKVLENIVKH